MLSGLDCNILNLLKYQAKDLTERRGKILNNHFTVISGEKSETENRRNMLRLAESQPGELKGSSESI